MTVSDRRYNSQRWRRVRRLVLQRDMYRCWITGCPRLANQCDHIILVEPGFPDSLFFGMNKPPRIVPTAQHTARGVAAKLERETSEGVRRPLSLTMFQNGRPRRGSIL